MQCGVAETGDARRSDSSVRCVSRSEDQGVCGRQKRSNVQLEKADEATQAARQNV